MKTDGASERRKLRSVGAYPDPFLVTRLPVEATVARGVVKVGEKSLLGFVDQPFVDGTRVRVFYDGWLFAEVLDPHEAAGPIEAEPAGGPKAGQEQEVQITSYGTGQGQPAAGPDEHAPGVEGGPTSESDEATAGEGQPTSELAGSISGEVPALGEPDEPETNDFQRAEASLAGEEMKAEPEPASKAESGETAAEAEPPGTNVRIRPNDPGPAKEPVQVVPPGERALQPDLFPEDLTRSDSSGAGDSRGQRDSWTDAFSSSRRSSGDEEE